MKTQFTFDLKTILIVVIIIFISFGGCGKIMTNKVDEITNKLDEQKRLTEALYSDLKITKNKLDEEIATKNTIQVAFKDLKKIYGDLNNNQKELVNRIKGLERDNKIISAALIETSAKIDSLKNNSDPEIDTTNKSITFPYVSDSISFNTFIGNVIPFEDKTPYLTIFDLNIPNKQFITFSWEDNNEYKQKPVTFSVTNSNSIVKTLDVNSYVIPEVNENAVDPTGWQKTKKFFKKSKNAILVGTAIGIAGGVIGATAF